MREVFWTPEAIQDRDDIYEYIEADNPAAALALDELFAEKAGRLIDHPGLGKPGPVVGTRELVRAKEADDTSYARGDRAASDVLGYESVKTTQRHHLRRGKIMLPTR